LNPTGITVWRMMVNHETHLGGEMLGDVRWSALVRTWMVLSGLGSSSYAGPPGKAVRPIRNPVAFFATLDFSREANRS
jgi:hypothetical protein